MSAGPEGGGAAAAGRYALCRAGASAGSLVRGRGREDQQGWGRLCCPTKARRARSRAMGGLPRRALSPKADVLPPRRDILGGQGWDRAGHMQALTR